MKKTNRLPNFLLICILVLFFMFFIIPMLSGAFISFTDWNGLSKDYTFIGLDNYFKMLTDYRFIDSFFVTIKYALVLLVCTLLLGYTSAKVVQKTQKAKSKLLFISFFPYIITPVVSCILWNQIYISLIPSIGEILNSDFLKYNLLANKTTALYAVTVVDLWMLVPYAMLLFLSSLNSIPKSILEHAKLEGANTWKISTCIELPYNMPTIGMLITVITSYAFTHIDTIMTLTSGGPGRVTETLYYTIYKNSFLEQRYAYGLAEGLVVAIVSILVFVLISCLTNNKNLESVTSE